MINTSTLVLHPHQGGVSAVLTKKGDFYPLRCQKGAEMGTSLLTKQIEKYTNANSPASLWQHLDRQMIISGEKAGNASTVDF